MNRLEQHLHAIITRGQQLNDREEVAERDDFWDAYDAVNLAAPDAARAIELVAQLSAVLDTVLLHQGFAMTEADRASRRALVTQAETFLGRGDGD